MRNLAIRIVLWLCDRFAIAPLDETRSAMDKDAKARSIRWEQFAKEEGGLFDMIETLRRETFEQASEIPPEDVAKLQYAAMSDRNLRRLKQRIVGVIASGRIEEHNEAAKARPRILKSV